MTIKKIIDGLYFTVGMILFNPLTGGGKTPEELNEDDRTTYDACMGAIESLKAQEAVKPVFERQFMSDIELYDCGKCGTSLGAKGIAKYCMKCGQAVKWE